ncbi:MAG TPA: arylsulfatase [Phycisphaerae bacterium]|jgi:arylsulfatase A-like enzyme|nr:arylsulfatase [Phycisphaerae bacterium]HOB75825.1 arylsulfatase [Phycisphaerae bacterium]HOJ54548.1 arylsulfatase [Phycisphaerae bacterium]HOL27059.1 arylsulfatase [Phycisphaerae bacterium]HPP22143.1 arylsulfatase [Phycisphaerae bacterium]
MRAMSRCWLLLMCGLAWPAMLSAAPDHPNIVIILADDLGFSDLGCYGSEIATPNLDRLAAEGMRFTRFYNAGRCCSTRAALLTGQYPHRTGIGHMTANRGLPGYQGFLNDRCITLAEGLGPAGYECWMSGKWHVGAIRPHWPLDRGFARYFGLIGGANSYFGAWPGRLMLVDNEPFQPGGEGYYITDAITDRALRYLDDRPRNDRPFFLYVAYTAPHAPLHARPEDIARYRGKYDVGWDVIRQRRYERLRELGLIDGRWPLSPRDPGAPAWSAASDRDRWSLRMAVYAAQVDRMDYGIGRILQKLRDLGLEQNTLVMFLSDNGGDSEEIDESLPGAPPGHPDSSVGYGLPWANVSNTPFRQFKRTVHEGGIATPLIVRWPAVLKNVGRVTPEVGHVIDILPTCLEAAGVAYPQTHNGRPIAPPDGRSLLATLRGERREGHTYLFWEHEGNRAVRNGKWKLVAQHAGPWELYDLEADRTELNDLADRYPEQVRALAARYEQWAAEVGVVPWEKLPRPRSRARAGGQTTSQAGQP